MILRKRGVLGFLILLVAVLALAAAGCGGDDDDDGGDGGGGGGAVEALPSASCGPIRKGEEEPDALIASDFPLQGANRSLTTEMADAIEYMLEQQDWKAGDTVLGYQSCDDSTAQAGSWDSAKCSSNGRAYANNASVIGVIGTFNSGCAKLVIPIANRESLAMVSPANTYPGLTEGGPGTEAGEPDNYYPSGTRNYARVVWNDQFQGAANAQYAKELGLKKIFILNDGETYGLGIAQLFEDYAGEARHPDPGQPEVGQEGVELRVPGQQDQLVGRGRRLPRRHRLQQRRQADQGHQGRSPERPAPRA